MKLSKSFQMSGLTHGSADPGVGEQCTGKRQVLYLQKVIRLKFFENKNMEENFRLYVIKGLKCDSLTNDGL